MMSLFRRFCCCCPPPGPREQAQNTPPEQFDGKAFCDAIHDLGRAYRHRADALIRICRIFSAASEQTLRQDKALSSVLEICDQAICRAVELREETTTEESDFLIERATQMLEEYDEEFHRGRTVVGNIMTRAETVDEGNKYKRWDHAQDERMIDVEFHIWPTLPFQNPTRVRQLLRNRDDDLVLRDILWNFSHYEKEPEKRLTLSQNPHFYIDLPKSSGAYGGAFNLRPRPVSGMLTSRIHDYHGYQGRPAPIKIYVLTNASGRVFFGPELYNFGTGPNTGRGQAFDKVWTTDGALVFKGVHGELNGELSVESPIHIQPGTRMWYHVQPRSQVKHEDIELIGDTNSWTDLIKKLGQHRDANIIIGTTMPSLRNDGGASVRVGV